MPLTFLLSGCDTIASRKDGKPLLDREKKSPPTINSGSRRAFVSSCAVACVISAKQELCNSYGPDTPFPWLHTLDYLLYSASWLE